MKIDKPSNPNVPKPVTIPIPKPPYSSTAVPAEATKCNIRPFRVFEVILAILVAVNLFAFGVAVIYSLSDTADQDQTTTDVSDDTDSDACDGNVAGIELHGELVTYIPDNNTDEYGTALSDQSASENIVASINEAEQDDNVKAILLEVDSTGGSPVAGEEIAIALKNAQKPTVALIRDYGVSAAYWAATGSNIIFASSSSDVGGIGVTMSYLDYSKQNEADGITYQEITSGKLKDAGNPDKPLTDEERTYFERDIAILAENFINAVSINRAIPLDNVRQLADGSSVLGKMGLEKKLIDRIGGMPEVEAYLAAQTGSTPDFCWY